MQETEESVLIKDIQAPCLFLILSGAFKLSVHFSLLYYHCDYLLFFEIKKADRFFQSTCL